MKPQIMGFDLRVVNIPDELKSLPQWVHWKRVERNGEGTKLPYNPKTGNLADSTNPETWGTIQEALIATEIYGSNGVGFVFSAHDPYCGIDLDSCRDPETGAIEPEARRYIGQFNSYTEITPSGKGFHIIVKGSLPPGRRRKGKIEHYDRARYFTFTGNVLNGSSAIADRQAELEAFHEEIFGAQEESGAAGSHAPMPVKPLDLDDETLIERAKGADDGGKFSKLWAGDWAEYPSRSEADQALCNKLAFWTERDRERMNRLFRRSGLYRKKWDRSGYSGATLNRAISLCSEVYKPPKAKPEPCNGECPPTEWPAEYSEAPPPNEGPCAPKKLASMPDSQKEPHSLEDAILKDIDLMGLSIPEKQSFLSPWLNESSIVSIVGWRGVGKSLFTLGCVDAITKARPFGPWTCGDPVNCLIVDGEMAVQDCKKRISDLGTAGRKSTLLYYADSYAYILGQRKASLLDFKWRKWLAEYMLQHNIRLWVCDNVASFTGGIDENSKAEWDPINQWFLQLRFAGITTMLVHHEGKMGTQRGTSAREDNLDVCISLKKPPDYTADQGARFIVNFTKSRIPLDQLPLIANHEFQLSRMAGDVYGWIWSNARTKDRKTILCLIDEGIQQNDIAKQLDVTPSWVSKIKNRAIMEGSLTKSGKLTQKGFSLIYSDKSNNCAEMEND